MQEALNTAGETVVQAVTVIIILIIIGVVLNLLGAYLTRSSKTPYKK